MLDHLRSVLSALALALTAGLLACDASTRLTEPTAEDVSTPAFAEGGNGNGAVTERGTFTNPFPPNPNVESIAVPAPCLGLPEAPRMSGTWIGRFQSVQTPNGRMHIREWIDWDVTISAGDLSWIPGPGADETLVFNVSATPDAPGALNVKHEFHVRFLSQDGLPDLRVTHRVKQLLGPDGLLRKNEFVSFTAECIGGGA